MELENSLAQKGRFFALSKLENHTRKKRKRKNRKSKVEKKQWLHYNELVFILTILDSGFHNWRAWIIPTTEFIAVKGLPRTTIYYMINNNQTLSSSAIRVLNSWTRAIYNNVAEELGYLVQDILI